MNESREVSVGESVGETSVVVLVASTTLGMNGLNVVAFLRLQRTRSSTRLHYWSLTAANLLTGLLTLLFVQPAFTHSWLLPIQVCHAAGYLLTVGSGASIYTLAGLSVERALVITRPLDNRRLIRTRNAAFSITLVWLYAAAMPIWSFYSRFGNLYEFNEGSFVCSVAYRRSVVSTCIAVGNTILITGSVISVSWIAILAAARSHRHRMNCFRHDSSEEAERAEEKARALRSSRKQFRTIAAITLSYYATWLPYAVRQCWLAFTHQVPSPWPDFPIDWLALSHGFWSSFIYALTDREYRSVLAGIVAGKALPTVASSATRLAVVASHATLRQTSTQTTLK